MRKYTKILCLLLLISIVTPIFTSCALFENESDRGILKKPDNWVGSVWIGDVVEDLSIYEKIANYYYYESGYPLPDSADRFKYVRFQVNGDKCVEKIIITDPGISIYGLTVNSSLDEFSDFLKKEGFKVEVDIPNESEIDSNIEIRYNAQRKDFHFDIVHRKVGTETIWVITLSCDLPDWTDDVIID